jgi:hypothetical protein
MATSPSADTQQASAARTMPEFCQLAELGEEATALLEPEHTPRDFMRLLVEREHFPDAVRFLAHALPRREGIWWAWVCARGASGEGPPAEVKAALDATERWVTHPTDENRRAAFAAAETATLATPAGCAALAVFFSGGSLGPADTPAVPPGEFMTAKAITGAVMASAVCSEPERAPEKYRAYISHGLEVVKRLALWGPE